MTHIPDPTPKEIRDLQIQDRVNEMKGVQSLYYSVVVEGREIPNLRMVQRGDQVSLQVDGRFETDVPAEYAPSVAWLLAQALAVGSGYAYLGSPNKDRPFAPEVRGLPTSKLGEGAA